MKKIIYEKMALQNLMKIKNYISMDSIYYASKTFEGIKSKIQTLKLFPQIGRKIPEYNRENMREILFKSYRIQYKFNSDTIYILRIFHHSLKNFSK